MSACFRAAALRGVPLPTGRAHRGGCGQGQAGQRERQERIELGEVCRIRLRVDLPHEGPPGPDRAHQRILAAHEVEIARPQQVVIVELAEPRQRLRAQRTRRADVSHRPRDLFGGMARGGQQQRGLVGEGAQQLGQVRVVVAKQAHHAIAGCSYNAVIGEPALPIERGLPRDEVALAQQATGAVGKSGIEKMRRQAAAGAAGLRRWQAVAALDVGLGAEVLEVDPQRRQCMQLRTGHDPEIRLGQAAAEGLDHHVGRFAGGRGHIGVGHGPRQHLNARATGWRHPGQRARIVDPQTHADATGCQISRQAPAHAGIAVVVDDAAKDIPGHGARPGRSRGGRHRLIIRASTMAADVRHP